MRLDCFTRPEVDWDRPFIIDFSQEPGTKNWRYGSKDIHLFQEMMNPHLMKLYPKTKVVFTLCISIIHPISKTLYFRRSCGSIMLSGAGISPETNQCAYKIKYQTVPWMDLTICYLWQNIFFCFRAPSPHLDYFQDDEARHEFHKTFPLINPEHSERNVSEGHVLTGHYDTEDLEARVMLGVWKPLSPTEVKL